jgi:hypothetical protein
VAITTGTKILLSPLSLRGLKVPRLNAYLALGAMLGAASIPGKVFGEAGDFIDSEVLTYNVATAPYGMTWDDANNETNWMTLSGDIYKGRSQGGITKILDSLDPNDEWKYLAEVEISGEKNFVSFNDTDDMVVIRNADTGAEWGSWTYPGPNPEYFRGLAVNDQDILCYNSGWGEIQRFSLTGTHLDDMLLPYPAVQSGEGMAVNPQDGSIIMNGAANDKYNVIWFTGTEYDSHETIDYSDGGANSKIFSDICFNAQSNILHIAARDNNEGDGQMEYIYEGPPQAPTASPTPRVITPTPTPRVITPTPTITPKPTATPIYTPTPSSTPQTLEDRIGIFRPTSGLWAIKDTTREYFGATNDIPIYGDFSGDGTKDIGIFRPSSGLWAIKGVTRAYFGGPNDKTVPGDYNGNGTADMGIFREDSGLWAIRNITRAYFGGPNDKTVPGDYNGNGTADIGIFREDSGLWAIRRITRAYFGGSLDRPIPGDYTGDGSSDIGIFRPASGLWAIKGVTRSYFGGLADEPVPGDYDDDSSDDIGIFRDISGLWAIKAVTRCYFGTVGDIPVAQ